MEVKKKVSAQGEFAKAGKDFNDGDMLQFVDAGVLTSGDYGEQTVFKMKMPSGEDKNVRFNQTSINNCIDGFGTKTEEWVGKEVKVFRIMQSVSGEMKRVAYYAPSSWDIIEEGDRISFGPKA